jgi:CubicO group peptidase (beta-lactamase class C family)
MADWEARLDRVMDEAIAANRIVGGVLIVRRRGELAYRRAAGLADREAGRPMHEDAIFRLASVTKPLVAATALALIERGTLSFDRKVHEWLPDFRPRTGDGRTPDITIRHLLTHTAGFGYATGEPDDPMIKAKVSGGLDAPGLGMEENLRRLASIPLFFAPGSAWRYGVNIDVLGAIIGKANGTTLGEAVSAYVTEPLGMADTAFAVTDRTRLAAAYADSESGAVLMGDPHRITFGPGTGVVFSPSRIFRPESFQSGGAGMAGTAPDFMRFLEAISTGGGPILKPETVDLALRNQVGTLREPLEPGTGFGLISGIMTDPRKAGRPYSPGTARWGGVYGHDWFLDQTAGLAVISMTNTAVEGCMGRYRDEIVDAIYG